MSNTTVTESFLNTVSAIQTNVFRYGYSTIFLFGNVGSILNVLVLAQRSYRHNSCSCYILASTIIDLFLINFIVLFRILTGFNIDPTKTSWFFCKFRAYMAQMLTILSRTYILLACIDRWAMTSRTVERRAFTRLKVPKMLIPSVAIVWSLFSLHVPFYQNIVQGRCVMTPASYINFFNIYNATLSGVLIPASMLIFGLLTIRNVQQLKHRVGNKNVIHQANLNNRRNFDYQLSIMILVQLGVYLLSNLPFASYLLYVVFTMNSVKSSYQTGINNLYMTFVYFLPYINFGGTFYLYTLTSQVFRKDLKGLLIRNRVMTTVFHTQTVAPRNTQLK